MHFAAEDFAAFGARLREETAQLERALAAGDFAAAGYVAGFELEAWLVDHNHYPAPINERYLKWLDSPLVVPELSRFNVELNSTPEPLGAQTLARMKRELTQTWRHCQEVAHELDAALIMIGILPTIRKSALTLKNMSPMNRYYALNEQVFRSRAGKPLRIEIVGRERLALEHPDVMLEAATTSFQVHLQVPAAEAPRYYNASILLSAPIVAACANSPFLFGKQLWEETRIPLFEQAVDVGGEVKRVTFGSGYLPASPLEYFAENRDAYPVLLPIHFDAPRTQYRHLRLHNGTIWRWNRLLVGFDRAGLPHLRIEHRVIPSGPTVADCIANAALYLGLVHFHAQDSIAPESRLAFEQARENFYRAARDGLEATIVWLDGRSGKVRERLLEELIPQARQGLLGLGIAAEDAARHLSIVEARVASGQTGAAWQRAYAQRVGYDWLELSVAYLRGQQSGVPVHEWDV